MHAVQKIALKSGFSERQSVERAGCHWGGGAGGQRNFSRFWGETRAQQAETTAEIQVLNAAPSAPSGQARASRHPAAIRRSLEAKLSAEVTASARPVREGRPSCRCSGPAQARIDSEQSGRLLVHSSIGQSYCPIRTRRSSQLATPPAAHWPGDQESSMPFAELPGQRWARGQLA